MNEQLIPQMIAQATTRPAPPSGTEVFMQQILPLLLMLGVFFWFLTRSQKRERQKFENMLSSLKRNDRVVTIGGMFGTVVEVRDSEVVLKVDESNNIKIRFARSAIKEVLREPAQQPAATTPAKK
ncbi:MAG: preprotein translocase subunit YajC [Phycisphaerales bacterium]|nr:preprotein translocase subunit YajC [Phycisphaerales bacterium]